MGTTTDPKGDQNLSRMGLKQGQIVQEFGYDDDVDEALRESITAVVGEELLDEDAQEVVDIVLFWWRDGDGDLVDALMDGLTNLDEGGDLWLLTPKQGRPAHVESSDIEEAAPTAGLHVTTTISACADWTGSRLAAPRSSRR